MRRVDYEHFECDAFLARDVGRPEVQSVETEHARHRREKPRPVGRNHGHTRIARDDDGPGRRPRRANLRHEIAVLGRQQGSRGRWELVPFENCCSPAYEIGDETRLPRPPSSRPGRKGVGLGQGCEQVEALAVSDRPGHRADRGRVVEIAPCRKVGQKEVVANEVYERVDVFAGESHPDGDAFDDVHSGVGVIPGRAFADVVEEGRRKKEIGSRDAHRQCGGLRRGLEKMAIDRVAVVGVSLRLVAHRVPLGHQPRPDAVVVERLERAHRARAGSEHSHERGAKPVGPWFGRRWSEAGELGQASAAHRQVSFG